MTTFVFYDLNQDLLDSNDDLLDSFDELLDKDFLSKHTILTSFESFSAIVTQNSFIDDQDSSQNIRFLGIHPSTTDNTSSPFIAIFASFDDYTDKLTSQREPVVIDLRRSQLEGLDIYLKNINAACKRPEGIHPPGWRAQGLVK